ncbi:MAG: hypothetical protein HYZ53_09065 [Planctomycetes bacterium]|nr:hypothetical protein [Planctomycetota bacterium]
MDTTRQEFVQALRALEPYLPQLIVVGGWAHRLFHFHEWARPVGLQPLTTDDTDILAPMTLEGQGKTVRTMLLEAGFEERLWGDRPPVTKYYSKNAGSAFHVEFIGERRGGPVRRDGASNDAREVSGVTVQQLAHVELLREEPWALELDESRGYPVEGRPVLVRVVNPVSYLAQKVLVLPRADRSVGKRAKDILYVHDTLLLMSAKLEELRKTWERLRARGPRKRAADLARIRAKEFSTVTDRILRAAEIARESGRPSAPGPETIRDVCRVGLERVFG